MKSQLPTDFFFLLLAPAHAQLGITAVSTQSRATEWQVVPENFITHRRADFLRYGTSGVVDYVFTLKNEAIRLRPAIELFYANSIYYPHYFYTHSVGVQGNIEFALWGAVDKKGNVPPFRPFLQFSPGVSWVSLRYDRLLGDQNEKFESFKSHSIAPNLGANVFLEFKLTKLLTIAPTAGVRIYPNLNWKDFTEIVTEGSMVGTYDRTNLRQFNFGMRVGLTFK